MSLNTIPICCYFHSRCFFFPFFFHFDKTAKTAQFIPVCLSLAERWLKGINNVVCRWHTCFTLGLHFLSTWKRKKREGQADSLSSLSLSACVCVFMHAPMYMCVYLCSYGSSEMIQDKTWLPRNVNDPELGLYLNVLQCLNYFRVNFMNFEKNILLLQCVSARTRKL